jgi:hypothetical protein
LAAEINTRIDNILHIIFQNLKVDIQYGPVKDIPLGYPLLERLFGPTTEKSDDVKAGGRQWTNGHCVRR